jgi:hypothetical protein
MPARYLPHWQRYTQTESERMENVFQTNGIPIQAGMLINADFKAKLFNRDIEGHSMLLKGMNPLESIIITNKCPKY